MRQRIGINLTVAVNKASFFQQSGNCPGYNKAVVVVQVLIFLNPIAMGRFVEVPSHDHPIAVCKVFLSLGDKHTNRIIPLRGYIDFHNFIY